MLTKDSIFHDAVIIGGGPSGSAAAYWLAKKGIDVAVIEKKSFPREKTCGDGLTPRALKQLLDMGLDESLLGHRYLGLRAKAFGKTLELPWPQTKDYPEIGYCITRYDLDSLTKTTAEKQGATFYQDTEAIAVNKEKNQAVQIKAVDKKTHKTKDFKFLYLIIADGSNSRIGRQLGVTRDKSYPLGLAIRSYFSSDYSTDDFIESRLDIRDEHNNVMPGYGWIFPLGDGRLNVGAGLLNTSKQWKGVNTTILFNNFIKQVGPDWKFTEKDLLQNPTGGKLPMGLSLKPRFGTNWLCAGDALGAINPFNGEGISYAYETGRLAANYISQAIEHNLKTNESYFFLQNYNNELVEKYRIYYDVASRFVELISNPKVMKFLVSTGMKSSFIMEIVLEIMANLLTDKKLKASKSLLKIAARIVEML